MTWPPRHLPYGPESHTAGLCLQATYLMAGHPTLLLPLCLHFLRSIRASSLALRYFDSILLVLSPTRNSCYQAFSHRSVRRLDTMLLTLLPLLALVATPSMAYPSAMSVPGKPSHDFVVRDACPAQGSLYVLVSLKPFDISSTLSQVAHDGSGARSGPMASRAPMT